MKLPKMPKVMSKQANRGEFAKSLGGEIGKRKKPLVSYVEGTKANKGLPHPSLTPPARLIKKKK